jgi:hypothetical protein
MTLVNKGVAQSEYMVLIVCIVFFVELPESFTS